MGSPDLSISSSGSVFYLLLHRVHWCCCHAEWVWLQSYFHQMKSHLPQGGLQRDLRTGRKTQWCTARQATELCCPHGLSALNLIWNEEAMWIASKIVFWHSVLSTASFFLFVLYEWQFFILLLLIKMDNAKRHFMRIIFHSQSHPHKCFFISPCLPTYCLHCSNWLNTYSFLAMMDKCKGDLQDEEEVSIQDRPSSGLLTAGGN